MKTLKDLYLRCVKPNGGMRACLSEEEFIEAMENEHPELKQVKLDLEQAEYLEALDTMLRQFNDKWDVGKESMWLYFKNKSGQSLSCQKVHDYFKKTLEELNRYRQKYGYTI